MPIIIFFTVVTLTVFLIMTEVISLEISYRSSLTVKIDFIIFGIQLHKDKSKKGGQGTKKIKGKRLPSFSSLLRFARRILKRGKTSVVRAVIPISTDEPHKYANYFSFLSLFISLLTDLLKGSIETVDFEEIILPKGDNTSNKPELLIKSVFPLRILLYSLIGLIYDYLKDGYRKYARRKNE